VLEIAFSRANYINKITGAGLSPSEPIEGINTVPKLKPAQTANGTLAPFSPLKLGVDLGILLKAAMHSNFVGCSFCFTTKSGFSKGRRGGAVSLLKLFILGIYLILLV
jgi:hypothetical protein